jgi:hypothetical protein
VIKRARANPRVIVGLLGIIILLSGALAAATAQPALAEGIGNGTYSSTQGFDTCYHPSAGGFQDWWSDTPNYEYGTYLGGSGGNYVGCTNIGTGLLDDAVNDGYGIIPAWYGEQMPTSCGQVYYPDQISTNTTTAYDEGADEARSAAAEAEAQGYDTYDIIYYDLEGGWDTGSSTCVKAAVSFISGWDYTLEWGTPYVGGLYGSTCSSDLSAFASASTVPADVWGADQNNNPEIYNLQCLSNNSWKYNQRIHQFTNPVNLDYNGYSMPVDEDCADALIDGNGGSLSANNCEYVS